MSSNVHKNRFGLSLQSLGQYWKSDLISGFFIFLIALPLSIGIACASNFPPMAGVITAVVGGFFVSLIQGSFLTIKGPAAGLIVIVYGCVGAFGGGTEGYEYTLAVIILSGILQIILGLFRTGLIADIFPSAVVHGMLASVGLIIVVRQIPVLLGAEEYSQSLFAPLSILVDSWQNSHPQVAFIGVVCLFTLIVIPFLDRYRWLQLLPTPMLVVVIAVVLGYWFNLQDMHQFTFVDGSKFRLDSDFLIDTPKHLMEGLAFPRFGKLFSWTTWNYVLLFTLVGSIESLASAKAIDMLDPQRRTSDLNKDLVALGVGNILCGFFGALPMINEALRSSYNIQNGGKTPWSNLFHGMFLLGFVLFAPSLVHRIPLTAVAALLIYVGLKLATPKLFIEMFRLGTVDLIIFLITIYVCMRYDILVGIGVGTAVNMAINIYAGAPLRTLFSGRIRVDKDDKEKTLVLRIRDSAIFSNFTPLKTKLDNIPSGYTITLDFSTTKVVDNTVLEHLHYYGENYQKQGGMVAIQGMENMRTWSAHPLSFRVMAKATDREAHFVSSRTKELKETAKRLQFKFSPFDTGLDLNTLGFESNALRVRYEANIIFGSWMDCVLRVSDISVSQVAGMKPGVTQLTILSISHLPFSLPVFSMHEEGILDKFLEFALLKSEDIDFKDFPELSNKYLLKGLNEAEVRNFFQPSLISFLEKSPHYTIESNLGKLIIYKNRNLASSEDIIRMVDFGKQLIQQISVIKLYITA